MAHTPPSLHLPAPLRAAEADTFTAYSVITRLPEIARRALSENTLSEAAVNALRELIAEIPAAPLRDLRLPDSAVARLWAGWLTPYLGQNWLEIPWFLAEEYFYVRLLEATGYFADGPGSGRDPYALQKHLGLANARAECAALAEQVQVFVQAPAPTYPQALASLLQADLWGNQKDLSMWPAAKRASGLNVAPKTPAAEANFSAHDQQARNQAHLLADDLPSLMEQFSHLFPAARVDVLLDNAGQELINDLAVVDFLLSTRLSQSIVLHTKPYPVFVSDALTQDVLTTLDFLVLEGGPAARAMGVRLRTALVGGRLRLQAHPFWVSPLPIWEMPDTLEADLRHSRLLIVKGDANYRRLLGDRHWPMQTPFAQVVPPLPCAVLALRTLKSEIAVGIDPMRIPHDDPQWMINGRWGLIQFAVSA